MTAHVRPTDAKKLIKGATGDWEIVIGLEIHAQVTSNAKLFSGASTRFGGDPNSHVSLVDAAMPGMLPVINAEAVAQALCMETEDFARAYRAFAAKQKPVFDGN